MSEPTATLEEGGGAVPSPDPEPGAGPQAPDPGAGPQSPPPSEPVELEPGVGPEPPDEDDDVDAPADVDAQEELEPKTLPVERHIVDTRGRDATYTQKGLTYFGKIELYGILGRAVEIAMEGGAGIDEILSMASPKSFLTQMARSLPGADEAPDADEQSDNVVEAGKMMAAFARVVAQSPEILKEAYCVVLAIPTGARKWAMDWGLPNIDDDMGNDILHTFIDQNWGVMEDFFTQELPKVFRRAAKARQRHQSAGAQSKR